MKNYGQSSIQSGNSNAHPINALAIAVRNMTRPRTGDQGTLCKISQQMHYYDSLLITFYSSYMFRRMYVIIREPSFECPAELR
jgi:hypothetical protein